MPFHGRSSSRNWPKMELAGGERKVWLGTQLGFLAGARNSEGCWQGRKFSV